MTTINNEEVEKFSRIADEWWSETGKFKPLHKFNPCRISYLRKKIAKHFNLDEKSATIFENLKIIDVGCGGGLISEPMARMGASVTAIDASNRNIEVAKIHAKKSGLKIDYQSKEAKDVDEKFDVVLALEVIEHVADVEQFIKDLSCLLKDNGILFIATINKTAKSLLFAKIGAEYVLRWLPKGTHDWQKFLKPSEINKIATRFNLDLKELSGFKYNLFKDEWQNDPQDLDVNYIAVFTKN